MLAVLAVLVVLAVFAVFAVFDVLAVIAKVYCRVKGIGVYESTCGQGSFCYKFDDGDLMEC